MPKPLRNQNIIPKKIQKPFENSKMYDPYSVCRMCLKEHQVSKLKNMHEYSVRSEICEKTPADRPSFASLSLFQIKIDKTFTLLASAYQEMSGNDVNGPDESPYICDECQIHLKFAHNLKESLIESDKHLIKIHDKIKAFLKPTRKSKNPAKTENQPDMSELKEKFFSNNYCRFCFDESSAFVDLFDADKQYNGKSLFDIYLCAAQKPLKMNELSSVICTNCNTHLVRFDEAREAAVKNDKYVKSLLQEAKPEKKKPGPTTNGNSNGNVSNVKNEPTGENFFYDEDDSDY